MRTFSDILSSINHQQCVLLISLNLRAAFDTIDHDVMFARIETLFGVSGEALLWFWSYFTERTRRVVLAKAY